MSKLTFRARPATGAVAETHIALDLKKDGQVLGTWLLTVEEARQLEADLAMAPGRVSNEK